MSRNREELAANDGMQWKMRDFARPPMRAESADRGKLRGSPLELSSSLVLTLLGRMRAPTRLTVLQYTSADHDRGGVMSLLRALTGAAPFECVLGVNTGFVTRRPVMPLLEFPRVEGEVIGWRTAWRARKVARDVKAWLAADKARIFHAHSRAGLLVAWWLVRWGERRVVASVHCYGRQRWFYRWAARQLDGRLWWLSPAMKRYYKIDAGESWDRCIPPCIPDALLDPFSGTDRPPSEVVRLGGAGLLSPWKGWHLMVDALAMLPAAVKARLHFTHIGSSDGSPESERYAADLRERTAALGLSSNIEWRGEQPSSRAMLAACDCAVVLSEQEPFSLVMLEALSAGVPVLASGGGGPTDVLEPGVTGWFFEQNNARSLAERLTMLVETNALRTVRIEPKLLRRFTASSVAEQWASVYGELVQGASASRS